jgi:hypothetical protein
METGDGETGGVPRFPRTRRKKLPTSAPKATRNRVLSSVVVCKTVPASGLGRFTLVVS